MSEQTFQTSFSQFEATMGKHRCKIRIWRRNLALGDHISRQQLFGTKTLYIQTKLLKRRLVEL